MVTNGVLCADGNGYMINGERYGRVTQVLNNHDKPWLRVWRNKVGEEEAERILAWAGLFGDTIHLATELSDTGRDEELIELITTTEGIDIASYVAAWDIWTGKMVASWVGIELILYEPTWRVAGRADRIAILCNEKEASILDIKTGFISDSVGMQLCTYKIMWNRMGERGEIENFIPVNRTLAICMHRKGDAVLKVKEYDSSKYEKEVERVMMDYRNLVQ